MTVKSAASWSGTFVTVDSTGALTAATGTPVGVLYVDGTANGASVTVTGSNPYKWTLTLPSLTAGQRCDMYITATVSTIATGGVVASEQADTKLVSDLQDVSAATVNAQCDTAISDAALATASALATVDGNVDAILVDTGTTLDGKLDTIDTNVDSILSDTGTDGVVVASGSKTGYALSSAGVNAVADQVWDEALSGHADSGSTGEALSTAGSGASAADIADAVCDEVLSGHTTAGTVGKALGYVLSYLDGTFTTLLAAIWSHSSRTLTQSAASVTSAVTGSAVTVYRGTRWEITLTGLTDFTGYSKVYFTAKQDVDDTDAESVVHVQESTAGTGNGLVYFEGAAATAAHGSITVNSSTSITIYVEIAATADAKLRDCLYGVKWIDTDGHAHLASIGGTFSVRGDIPLATT